MSILWSFRAKAIISTQHGGRGDKPKSILSNRNSSEQNDSTNCSLSTIKVKNNSSLVSVSSPSSLMTDMMELIALENKLVVTLLIEEQEYVLESVIIVGNKKTCQGFHISLTSISSHCEYGIWAGAVKKYFLQIITEVLEIVIKFRLATGRLAKRLEVECVIKEKYYMFSLSQYIEIVKLLGCNYGFSEQSCAT
ncbi:hypothetical protein ACTA71_000728 [Dictyostelium dimigraforme]